MLFEDMVQTVDVDEAPAPISIGTSGLDCVDFTPQGLQQGGAGRTDVPHSVWATDRIVCAENDLEDLHFTECSERYPIATKQSMLERTHELVYIKAGPKDVGFPIRRVRMLGCVINRSTLCWTGPRTALALELEFKELFGRTLEVDGEWYMQATQHDVASFVRRRARGRREVLPDGWADMRQEDVCTSS